MTIATLNYTYVNFALLRRCKNFVNKFIKNYKFITHKNFDIDVIIKIQSTGIPGIN